VGYCSETNTAKIIFSSTEENPGHLGWNEKERYDGSRLDYIDR
jgi:hypothetical protein